NPSSAGRIANSYPVAITRPTKVVTPKPTIAGTGSSNAANRVQNTAESAAAAAPSCQPVSIQSTQVTIIAMIVVAPERSDNPKSRWRGRALAASTTVLICGETGASRF